MTRLGARLMRIFFRLLYGPFAWTYDVVAWLVSFGAWTSWVRTALRFLNGPQVLELGHGPGHLQIGMAQAGMAPVGVDLSPQMGRVARRRVQRAGVPLRLVRARAQALPFRDGAFGDVVATFPTEYILDPATLREVARVLEPEGAVVVVAAVRFRGEDLLSHFLRWLYQITGQGEPLPREREAVFTKSALPLQASWLPVRRGEVLVVRGRRRPNQALRAKEYDTSECTSSPPGTYPRGRDTGGEGEAGRTPGHR